MRWPLSIQIVARLLLLLTLTVCSITYANIRFAIDSTRMAEELQLNRIVDLMKSTNFPLTTPVLENMKALSGAEFVLTDTKRNIVSSTNQAPVQLLGTEKDLGNKTINTPNASFNHAIISNVPIPNTNTVDGQLHVLVTRQSEQTVWWQASRSPLMIALIVLPIVFLVGLALANQVTKPLARLRNQVHQIAEGDVRQLPINRVDDEIKDLASSINEMATKLNSQEIKLRKNERLKTMVQFGRSIAHHLRNSAAGCRMAVELLGAERNGVAESENYQVAIRQLGLMNNYIKKFLLLSKSSGAPTNAIERINLREQLDSAAFLLKPAANHLNVSLIVHVEGDDSLVQIARDDADQLLMNLMTNAITAASHAATRSTSSRARVEATLNVKDGQFKFTVVDNGAGPPDDIAEQIFQPFVTGSNEGTGLGLSLVQEIASRLGGTVDWGRRENLTEFIFRSTAEHNSR